MTRTMPIGTPHIVVDGEPYELSWGRESLTVRHGDRTVAIKNARLARLLAGKSLRDVVKSEIDRYT